jgi:hypothetical protein
MRKAARAYLVLFLGLNGAQLAMAQNAAVLWGAFSQGYAGRQSGNTIVRSVVGQGLSGLARSSNTQVVSGFLGYVFAQSTAVSVSNNEGIPAAYNLDQNYPNPFNPTTVVSCQLPVAVEVRLVVYDLLGREVTVLVDQWKNPGKYTFVFDAKGLASGMYIYRMTAGEYVAAKKMMLLR